MAFRIVVEEITAPTSATSAERETTIERYRQTVEELDLRAVMAAVNQKKRGPRVKAEKK